MTVQIHNSVTVTVHAIWNLFAQLCHITLNNFIMKIIKIQSLIYSLENFHKKIFGLVFFGNKIVHLAIGIGWKTLFLAANALLKWFELNLTEMKHVQWANTEWRTSKRLNEGRFINVAQVWSTPSTENHMKWWRIRNKKFWKHFRFSNMCSVQVSYWFQIIYENYRMVIIPSSTFFCFRFEIFHSYYE